MRSRAFRLVGLLVLCGTAGYLTFSGSQGQSPTPPRPLPAEVLRPEGPAGVQPASAAGVPGATGQMSVRPKSAAPADRFRDLSALPYVTRQMVLSARGGMEWLHHVNQPNGRFVSGFRPALRQAVEGDSFLKQATAAFALARSARFSGEEGHAVCAGQAILSLLAETREDPAAPGARAPAAPSIVCNRLSAAGFLVMAVCELPDADAGLVARAEELCTFIRTRQRADGSLRYTDGADDDPARADPDGVNQHPGPALYALALSQRARPAAWKAEALRKAASYYRACFRARPHPALVTWLTAAYAEVFAQTREPAYATFVCEMNDWLCGLQYEQLDPRHPEWRGGFQAFADGKPAGGAPTVETALYAQSLADACRTVRHMPAPDTERYARYRTALVRSLQFLTTLQYAEDNTQHFVPDFRRKYLVGAFHPSHHDGDLRVEQSAWAVSALVQFLTSGAEKE